MERQVLNWDEYFMGIALLAGLRSKDPNSQVGAVIVTPDHKVVGTGYNGFVAGVDESNFTWERRVHGSRPSIHTWSTRKPTRSSTAR